MEIEIKKVERIIKDNQEKLNEIDIEGQAQCTTEKYNKLHNLFNCFIGDLYMLFGDECLEKQGKEYLQKLAEKIDKETMSL